MVEGVIPQAHLRKEPVNIFYTNGEAYIEHIPGPLKKMSKDKPMINIKTENSEQKRSLVHLCHTK